MKNLYKKSKETFTNNINYGIIRKIVITVPLLLIVSAFASTNAYAVTLDLPDPSDTFFGQLMQWIMSFGWQIGIAIMFFAAIAFAISLKTQDANMRMAGIWGFVAGTIITVVSAALLAIL